MHKARSIWYSGGAWVFGPGQNIFFGQNWSKIFFSAFGPDYFFFVTESYIYNI